MQGWKVRSGTQKNNGVYWKEAGEKTDGEKETVWKCAGEKKFQNMGYGTKFDG